MSLLTLLLVFFCFKNVLRARYCRLSMSWSSCEIIFLLKNLRVKSTYRNQTSVYIWYKITLQLTIWYKYLLVRCLLLVVNAFRNGLLPFVYAMVMLSVVNSKIVFNTSFYVVFFMWGWSSGDRPNRISVKIPYYSC